jgi:hypothetical protein
MIHHVATPSKILAQLFGKPIIASIMSGTEEKGRRLKNYFREFSENTTLHGVRFVGESNRHWAER